MNKLIKLQSLTKIYNNGAKVLALDCIDLEISKSDYLAIVGPSGSGKSTLRHIAGGLDAPTQGKALFKEENIYKMADKTLSSWRSKNIGFIFQFYHLIEELNALENIAVGANSGSRKYTFKKARELLKYLEIEQKHSFFPSQLSGGEKQKVAIARALINDPEILLADEPTGNLDSTSGKQILDLLVDFHQKQKKTIILITHDMYLVKDAQRVIYLKDGEVLKVETVKKK